MKKIIAVLLVLSSLILSLSACGKEDDLGLQYVMTKDGSGYTVAGVGEFTGSELVIPSVYKKKPVVGIATEAFAGNSTITTVVIPDSVKSIGIGAFKECSALTTVKLGEGLKSIGASSFFSCKKLETVTVGSNLEEVSTGAFQKCVSLKTITLPETLTSIDSLAFESCLSLKTVYAPSASIEKIGFMVFSGCNNLTDVYLGVNAASDKWNEKWNYAIIEGTESVIRATVHFGYTG